jgi:hypothetical protein
MNLMLSVLFACVAVGLLSARFGRMQGFVLVGFATVMALLYLFQGYRFI